MAVSVYDLQGHLVWKSSVHGETSILWDGQSADGDRLANGVYVAVLVIKENGIVYSETRTLFVPPLASKASPGQPRPPAGG